MEREDAYSLLMRGKELLKTGNPAQAAVVLERAKKLQPKKGSIREALGQAYYNYKQYDLARQEFAKAIEIDPTNHYAHFGLGLSYKQLRDFAGAQKHLKIALAMEPDNKDYQKAWQSMGRQAGTRKLKLVKKVCPINVKCYSGYKAEQIPRSFEFNNEWYEVVHVEKSWQEEKKKARERRTFYRVLTKEGKLFDISYNEERDEWLLERELKH